jgi:hypothetical protein
MATLNLHASIKYVSSIKPLSENTPFRWHTSLLIHNYPWGVHSDLRNVDVSIRLLHPGAGQGRDWAWWHNAGKSWSIVARFGPVDFSSLPPVAPCLSGNICPDDGKKLKCEKVPPSRFPAAMLSFYESYSDMSFPNPVTVAPPTTPTCSSSSFLCRMERAHYRVLRGGATRSLSLDCAQV